MSHTLVVGLEVHVQLLTRSKLFCGCATTFEPEQPNVHACPVCLGLPGALPVMNREAFRLALRAGLALRCGIATFTKWDRKQYFYPDLPKAYQISQYDLPFSSDGHVEIEVPDPTGAGDPTVRRIGIVRAHLEEDAGKNLHDESGRGGESRIDLNRCGTPLVEIVTQPDLRSAAEARILLEELRTLLVFLGVTDGNMQEGSLRCDANVNLHVDLPDGRRVATPIVEVKNLNTFRGVEQAVRFEEQRQLEEFRQTGRVLGGPGTSKTTRGWNADRGATYALREKEEASDYRYFPDPDLVPVVLTEAEIEAARGELCEFPADRRRRFRAAYELSAYDAGVIVDQGREFADYFEEVAKGCGDGKQAANWVTQDVLRELNDRKTTIARFPIGAPVLSALLGRVVGKSLTIKSAREVFAALLEEWDARRDDHANEDDFESRNEPQFELDDPSRPVDIRLFSMVKFPKPHASPRPASPRSKYPTSADIDRIVTDRGLAATADTSQLDAAIAQVMAANEKVVQDVRNGKQAAVGRLIGEVMKSAKGADAKVVRELLVERIGRAE